MSTSLRLCSVAPRSLIFWVSPRRRGDGTGMASSCRRYLAVSDRGLLEQPRQVAGIDHAAALLARAQADVDDVIGDTDHVLVVLDDEHGVALLPQLPQDVDQPLVVSRVEADRRLVEHVERADQSRPERRREVDPLRLAAGERGREPIERQVVQPDVAQKREPPLDFPQHLVRNGRLFLRQR